MAHNSFASFRLIHFLLWTKASHQSFSLTLASALVKICQIPHVIFQATRQIFQILHYFSMSWKTPPLYLFSSNNVCFAQKDAIKVKCFETFECSGQNLSNSLSQFSSDNWFPLHILRHSSLSWQITPLSILSSYFFNFGLKDPIKISILRFSSALVKNCHIRHVIFQTTSQFKVMLDKSVINVLGEGM